MRNIPLTNSPLVALVDDDDYADISLYKWRAHMCKNTTYAIRSWRKSGHTLSTYMHRQILKAEVGQDVDHIDRNGLNNLRENIRLMTRVANLHRSRPRSSTKSGLKGVWWSIQKQRWVADIKVGTVKFSLGTYAEPHLAAFAFNVAAQRLHGPDTFLNPIVAAIDPTLQSQIRARVLDSLTGIKRINQYI